jgi:cytochrome c-type biogenesis protein CcmH/NrfF
MEAYAAVLLWVIPGFFILVVIEITFGHFTKKTDLYSYGYPS